MATPFRPIRRTITQPGRQIQRGLRLLKPTDSAAPPEPPRDVWRWTSRKYRIRAVVLLLVNIVLFAGLCCFTYWLRTGEYTPFSGRPYSELLWKAFDPTGSDQITLTDFLLRPIPVDDVPLMMVVVSLVLASMTAVPILVSMLYRFPFALPFTAIIGFVAVFPWLAITVTFCCYLARLRPLRFSFRLATALISYLPVVLYYAMAVGDRAVTSRLAPLAVARLYLPWILAITFACLVMASVLLIARLVNYRPGAIAPLMTILFALPVVLFETKVGQDELYYRLRLLQSQYGTGSQSHFRDHWELDDLADQIAEIRGTAGEPGAREQITLEIQLRAASGQPQIDELVTLINEEFASQQHAAVAACQHFRRRFPRSRFTPNALYFEGQWLDTRIDPDFVLFRGMLYVRYYHDFPWRASLGVWRELSERFPREPISAVAVVRLATLEAREGRVDSAVARLAELIRQAPAPVETSTQPAGWSQVFAKSPAASGIDIDFEGVLLEARKLLDLLAGNRDPQYRDRPLCRLLGLDPRSPIYRQNLEKLLRDIPAQYPLTPLRDNVQVLLARSQSSPSRRIEELSRCIEAMAGQPDSDALPQARFELAVALHEDKRPEEARAALEQLQARHPASPWAAEAGRRLAAMGVAGRSQG